MSAPPCRSGDADRHAEHMDNVRLFHQSLQEQAASHSACSSSSSNVGEMDPSSSFLFAALRYHTDNPLWFYRIYDTSYRANVYNFSQEETG